MRILFFIDSLTAGGKERRFLELLKGLNQIPEIDFEIVLMSDVIHYQQVFSLNKKIHYLIRNSRKDLTVFRKFYTICKLYKPDLIHSWSDMTSIIAVPACKMLNIFLINGMVADTPVIRNISNKSWFRAKLTFPFSKIIIGNSKAGLKAYGAPLQKSICIYNGIDFNRFKNLKNREILLKDIFGIILNPTFIVGMVAAFEPRKDYETLVEGALSLVSSNENMRFILVGDGNNMIEIKRKIPFKLRDKIILLGRINDVESIVNLFDVGVLLTNTTVHGEGISNSIIEYMALSKPVIATAGGGTNEVVINNKNGFLINPKDTQQFIQSVQVLYNNEQLREKMGNTGNQTVHNTFGLNLMTKNYVSIYKNLALKRQLTD